MTEPEDNNSSKLKWVYLYIGSIVVSFILAVIFFIMYDRDNTQNNLLIAGYISIGIFAALLGGGTFYRIYDQNKSS